MSLLRATRGHVLLFLAGVSLAATPFGPEARARQAVTDVDGLSRSANGWLRLSADAGPAPRVIGDFDRFGMWDSPPARQAYPFRSVKVRYQDEVPLATERFVAVRASADGLRWSEWEWDVANGSTLQWSGAQQWLQHRIVLMGSAGRTPAVSTLELAPQGGENDWKAADAPRTAPTYRLRVTRQGMVGGRTANGHRITPRDMFVSLPSWTALSSKNGNEYKVRLSANGKSVVVPVMDVGPWNHNDNYWDAERARYKDLPVGWPQDHAAYFEKYNRGRAEKGIVRYPTAVDIGDGAYWALGLKGAQATVDVTFLWQGADPGPNPAPRNAQPSKRPEPPVP